MRQWILNVLLGLDQLANTLAGGNPDETLSSRSAVRLGFLRKFLNLFERQHSIKSLEYTPWGTVDPHHLRAIHPEIAADWNALIAVMESERDLDGWPQATLDAAQRALERLNTWKGRDRWRDRMARDLEVGDRFQK